MVKLINLSIGIKNKINGNNMIIKIKGKAKIKNKENRMLIQTNFNKKMKKISKLAKIFK